MKKCTIFCALLALTSSNVFAANKKQGVLQEFTETGIKRQQAESAAYSNYKKKIEDSVTFDGSIKKTYAKIAERITVPGLISARPIARIAKIIGPTALSYFVGDKIFLQWFGAPGPKEGAVYSIFTPAVVLQSVDDPTDFIARKPKLANESWPSGFREAGHMYDTTGEIRITNITGGIVEAIVTDIRSTVTIHDEIMLPMPRYESITPINGGYQISAAIVAGSPYERLSTMPLSFIYINRGSRDGMKVGRVFEAVESIKLQEKTSVNPKKSLGEAMVVFVTDAYSTAIVTKQFELMRIGTLLQSKQGGADYAEKYTLSSMQNLPLQQAPLSSEPELDMPQTPQKAINPLERLQKNLKLSELDQLEKQERMKALTVEERNRLNQLQQQEAAPPLPEDSAPNADDIDQKLDSASAAPSLPPPPSAFVQGKNTAQKDKKAKKLKKKSNDEEELNQLMMQN